ncbi:hypothetical protein M011DRAFT_465350 [Sporormia fimetaria CBS 119925]|uniref:Uncharacterized protein n=1 Tax=Sporormia fimetaria CBS 119925 TaxID=1340428 RepID=A0A6A6VGH9_9PLEO|nr:hypothetical protein M011DRAFT_465350 [Sporormia fimetaria CBS 119925]
MQLPPQYPPSLFSDVPTFPLAFLDDAQIRAWRTVKRLPKDSSFAFDMVLRLHHLGLATSSDWYTDVNQGSLSNLYFEAMYHAVRLQHEEIWNFSMRSGVQAQEISLMFRIWAAGLPLYIWGTIRHVRTRLGLMMFPIDVEPVLTRIKMALEAAGGHHCWPRGKKLEPVLATLVYGLESCDFASPWRPWAMNTLRRAVELLKLKTVEDFQKTLGFFPSTEEYRSVAAELWGELIYSSAVGTPDLRISPV